MSNNYYDEGSFRGQPEQNPPSLNNAIAKVHGKDKVLSFHDALIPALPQDYAHIHGYGGKKHAPVSGIKLQLCDYTNGTGEKSVTAAVNLEPTMFARMAHIAESNMGEYMAPMEGIWDTAVKAEQLQRSVLGTISAIIRGSVKVIAAAVKKETALDAGLGRLLADSKEGLKAPGPKTDENGNVLPPEMLQIPLTRDYLYTQTRVNSYKVDQQGFCPVSVLSIQRQGWYKGQARKNPWTIKVSNFEAMMKQSEKGTTSYERNSVRNKKDVYIQISDDDFYKACCAVDRFVRVWEMAVGPAAVKRALKEKEEERNAR